MLGKWGCGSRGEEVRILRLEIADISKSIPRITKTVGMKSGMREKGDTEYSL